MRRSVFFVTFYAPPHSLALEIPMFKSPPRSVMEVPAIHCQPSCYYQEQNNPAHSAAREFGMKPCVMNTNLHEEASMRTLTTLRRHSCWFATECSQCEEQASARTAE